MRLYRFRVVKPPSEFVSAHEHECSNDSAAAAKARTFCNDHNVEVWEGSRWVATIKENSGAPLSRIVP
jgi:hypothetical protein